MSPRYYATRHDGHHRAASSYAEKPAFRASCLFPVLETAIIGEERSAGEISSILGLERFKGANLLID